MTTFLDSDDDDDEQDPIVIAARQQQQQQQKKKQISVGGIRWKYCTESNSTQDHVYSNKDSVLNLIALGRTGDGKSSLLNDLMGKQVFKQKISAKSQTKDIQLSHGFWAPLSPYMHDKQDFGCKINVIDTPGFGDSQNRDQEFFEIIQNAMIETAMNKGGIHCILMLTDTKNSTNRSDTIFKSLVSLYNLISPYTTDFWNNVLLVFTHVDIVNGNTNRYQSQKVALKTKINQAIKEKYELIQDLPMLWISTQKYICGYLKGLGECDCEKGNRFHSDSRRRLYEQVWKRRMTPFCIV